VKKIHKLVDGAKPTERAKTECGLTGVVIVAGYRKRLQIKNANEVITKLELTDTATRTTCVWCVRKLLGMTKKRTRYFRSRTIRRSISPLGLLKG
jgi:hypothetical protein